MNKTKLIALSLVIALVLMGTAFAWWTQSTTISNKVNTGELEVKLVNIGGPGIYFTHPNGNPDAQGLDIHEDYNTEVLDYTFSEDGYSLNVEINNLFPGSYVTYVYGVDNIGTVPVKVNNVELIPTTVPNPLPAERLNNLKIAFFFRLEQTDANNNKTYSKQYRVDGTYSTIAALIKDELKDVVIVPGDRLVIGDLNDKDEFGQVQNGFIITIPEEWGNKTENRSVAFSLRFDYIQANAYTNANQ